MQERIELGLVKTYIERQVCLILLFFKVAVLIMFRCIPLTDSSWYIDESFLHQDV
jgi:hypothetical protein